MRPNPTCIYCGKGEGITRDHIPPKSLFASPRPRPVTVPCCERCRKSQSLDDEYFVRMIAMRRDASPEAASAREAVHRSFTNPNKIGLTRALLDSVTQLPVHTVAGVYLGHATTYDVNLQRLCNVIERTTWGLYYDEFKVRLPDDHRCKTYALDGFTSAGPEVKAKLRPFLDRAFSGNKRTLGNEDTFAYWVQRLDDANPATLWAFRVYSCTEFMAFTVPRQQRAH
jgi:hypothetical protein